MPSCSRTSKLPNFIIGGAPKCGTTALFDYLGQHPSVFTTDPKEPHFFASSPLGRRVMQGDYSREEYEALFAECRSFQVAGEASTHYLHHSRVVAPFMASVIPDVRLVFCLRDPVERAYSHFLFRYSTAGPLDIGGVGSRVRFEEFARDPEIFSMGDYASNIINFLRHFPKKSVLVLLFEDLQNDLPGTVAKVCDHIGVNSSFAFDLSRRSNETVYARWPALMPLFDRLTASAYVRLDRPRKVELLRARSRWLFDTRAKKPKLDRDQRAALAALYRPSVERLAPLIGRDLSGWTSR